MKTAGRRFHHCHLQAAQLLSQSEHTSSSTNDSAPVFTVFPVVSGSISCLLSPQDAVLPVM